MTFLKKISDSIYSVEKILAIGLCLLMFLSLFLGVVFRYVLSSPLIWANEMATFSLVWLTFIGGSMGVKQQESAAVTFLVDKVRGVTRKIIISMGLFSVIVFSFFMLYVCYQWLSSPNIAVQQSTAMQMPMIIPYISVAVGFVFIFIHSVYLFSASLFAEEGG
ncbi:TRAP transporter small permease [Salipaludibacillus sp. CF4.18]|uniref:TRAP transporter small permease n=1 Tax=Salipaludibacillus sp. CF4.18 TaxID=3373081 RepID=UPI003EE800F5